MWTTVTDVFTNENLESYLRQILDHMREVSANWRSDLLRYNVTNKKITLQAAYNNQPPNGLDRNEWRWLIKEIFSNDDFKKVTARNSKKRLNYPKELTHRTGSRLFRQVSWDDLGENKGKNLDLVGVFYKTCEKGNTLPNEETKQRHEEIRELVEKDPSLSHVQVTPFNDCT